MQTKIIAKAILFNEDGEVLLIRRSATDNRRPGEQDYPGGGVDPGEDVTAAVAREILEEAGLSIHPQDLHLFYTATELYTPPSGGNSENVTRLLFWGHVQNAEVQLSFEHDEFHWISPEKALVEFPHRFYGVGLEYGLKHKLFTSDT